MTQEQFQMIYDAIVKTETLKAKEVLSVDDCQVLTGLSKGHIYKLIWAKKIPYYKDPCGRKVHFKKSEIEKWLLSYRVPTADETAALAEKYCNAHPNNFSL